MINDKYTQQEVDFYNRVEALILAQILELEIQVGKPARDMLPLAYDDLGRCRALRAALVRIAKATVGGVDSLGGTGV